MPDNQENPPKPITLYDRIMNGGISGQVFRPSGAQWSYVVVGIFQGHGLHEIDLATVDLKDFSRYSESMSDSLVHYVPLDERDHDLWQGPVEQQTSLKPLQDSERTDPPESQHTKDLRAKLNERVD